MPAGGALARAVPRNRVLAVLLAAGLAAAVGLAFVSHAPNRLLSGRPLPLAALDGGPTMLALLPVLVLLAGAFLPQRRALLVLVALAAAALVVALCWLAGTQAALLAQGAPPAARTSLGAAFWVLTACAALAAADAARRLALSPAIVLLGGAAVAAAIAGLAGAGALDQLSLVKEYGTNRALLEQAVVRHAVIVAVALAPALLVGIPLGVLAHRRKRAARAIFPVLNVVQTIPAIALFGLLIAPLSGLAAAVPALAALGISGVGLAPATIALVLYALLPIVRTVHAGLAAVPAAAIDAAYGMGMTRRQMFRQVEVPLALPVFLAGLRITAVQTIGLAAVAALIGAGGLGAVMFQGLFANALDLAVLGTLPVVLMAVGVDGLLRALAGRAERRPA